MVISSFVKLFISKFFENFFKKNPKKTSYFENYKDLSSHIQRQNSQPLRVSSQIPITGLKSSKFWNFLIFIFFRKFWRKSSKTSYLEIYQDLSSHIWRQIRQSYWEAKFLVPESTLTEPHYRDDKFKFCEIFYTLVFGKILKKS